MKKFFVTIGMLLSMLFAAAFCVGCTPSEGVKVKATVQVTETEIAIVVESVEGDAKLIDAMTALQEEGKLTFVADGQGMIQSINGKENAADWSHYWALYISDAELSDMTYGIEWNGQQLGFSNFGAEALPIVEGGVYVWLYYQSLPA
ncbi:MAG: hypothetical protein IJF39_05920 [Clostridia bacterium]|nr:hypothetical protein [Clostridia bacterium]